MGHKKWLALAMLIGAITTAAVVAGTSGARPKATSPIVIGLVANSSDGLSA